MLTNFHESGEEEVDMGLLLEFLDSSSIAGLSRISSAKVGSYVTSQDEEIHKEMTELAQFGACINWFLKFGEI